MIFNYRDWLSWANWLIIIFVIFQYIIYWDTLIRWKWGYWSIDLIPSTIVLFIWWIVFTTVRINRLSDKVHNKEGSGKE